MSKANKIMNQRNEYKNEMINELETLGFNVSVLDELIPTTKEEPKQSIVINKGKIVEVQTVKEIVIDNTDYETIDKLKEQIKSLEAQIAELKQPKKEQPKNNSMAAKLEKVRKAEENKKAIAEKGWTVAAESALEQQKAKLAKEAEEKQAVINSLPEHTLEYDVISHKGLDTVTHFAIQGHITLDKKYAFEATNNHHMPIIYGCLNMDTINTAKEIMANKIDKFSFMNEIENNAANYDHINDAEFPLVVWRVTDDNGNVSYHGYTEKYKLIWDKKNFKYPSRKLIKNIFEDEKVTGRALWKRVENANLSDKFMAVCKELYAEDFAVKRGVVYEGPIDNFEVKVSVANDAAFVEECDDLDF